MENGKVFRTKSGYCHVLPDKIVLTRNGVVGELSKIVAGNNMFRLLTIYGLMAVVLLYLAYDAFRRFELWLVCICVLVSYYLVWGILRSKNHSTTPLIERSSIKQVEFIDSTELTRAYFKIHFEDANRKIKKRLIMLPGSLNGGKAEKLKAVAIMKEEQLLID